MSMTSILKSFFGGAGADRKIAFEDFHRGVAARTVAVVDVREPHEFVAGHVPGAINMPLSSFDPARLPNGKTVVLICMAGGRSGRALGVAVAAGRADVVYYPAGMNGWRQNGGEVV